MKNRVLFVILICSFMSVGSSNAGERLKSSVELSVEGDSEKGQSFGFSYSRLQDEKFSFGSSLSSSKSVDEDGVETSSGSASGWLNFRFSKSSLGLEGSYWAQNDNFIVTSLGLPLVFYFGDISLGLTPAVSEIELKKSPLPGPPSTFDFLSSGAVALELWLGYYIGESFELRVNYKDTTYKEDMSLLSVAAEAIRYKKEGINMVYSLINWQYGASLSWDSGRTYIMTDIQFSQSAVDKQENRNLSFLAMYDIKPQWKLGIQLGESHSETSQSNTDLDDVYFYGLIFNYLW